MKTYTIPVIPGDGIGPEVIAEGMKVLDAAAQVHGFRIEWVTYPHGADHYLRTGELLSDRTLQELSQFKAIYFGACGDERVPPGVLERGIVLTIRNHFDEYVNLRPIRLLEGVRSPLRDKKPVDIDFVVVRENTEDFYVAAGGKASIGTTRSQLNISRKTYQARFDLEITSNEPIAYQVGLISRAGARRVMRYALEFARGRKKHLTLIDKANVLTEMYGLWRSEFAEVATEFRDVQTDILLVDAAAMEFVRNPERFDVVLAPNLFGDILTDLGAMLQGGLGLAPGGNINPRGTSMFEPVHGSAPVLKGLQKANPVATIWAGAMLLDSLGENSAGKAVIHAIEKCLRNGRVLTPDLGGTSSTSGVGDEIARMLGVSA